jgi:uncharacterized protein YhaN
MRFSELQLIRYGRFEARNLVFGTGECDFQLILGPNEAGKSTTLEAVGDLLFGFPARTRFAFRFDQKLLRVGAVLENDGHRFEVRRRKGNIDTLLGGDDQPVEANLLAPHLAGQTRDAFERMFGLDHARLREGGKAILAAKDDIGAAIFAAGSGLVHVARVCEELESEAKAIWAKGAGESRRYTAALGAYQAAKAKLREVGVRPTAWIKAKKELESAEAELQALRSARTNLAQQRRTVQRQQLVLLPANRREQALRRLTELGGVPELAPDSARRCESALDDDRVARAEIGLARDEVDRINQDLEVTRPAASILAVGPEVDSLRELKGVVSKGAAEFASLQAKRDTGWVRICAAGRELGWPEEPAESLKSRLPTRAAVAEVRALIERKNGIDEQVRSARESLREADSTKQRLERLLADAPTVSDLRPLQDLVRAYRAAAHTQVREKAEKTSQELRQVLASRLRDLAPWEGDLATLRGLSIPAEEDVESALSRLDRARERLASGADDCSRERARLQQKQLELRQAVLTHPVPTREEVNAARLNRDAAWSPIKVHLGGGEGLEDAAVAADAFERAVLEGDRVADVRFEGAEHSGGLAALEREIEKSELQLSQAESRRDEARTELAAAEARFADLISTTGVAFSPGAYRGWRGARADALQAADGLDLALQDERRASEAEAVAVNALLQSMGRPSPDATSLNGLLVEAERLLDAAGDAREHEQSLKGQLTTANENLERANRNAQVASEAEKSWSVAWVPALLRAGLPKEATLVAARALLEVLDALRGEVENLLELDVQLEAIGRAKGEFERRVILAASQAGLDLVGAPGNVFVALQVATTAAAAKAERALTLEVLLGQAEAKIRDAEARVVKSDVLLAPLRGVAPEGDAAALRELLGRAAEAGRLRILLEEVENEIIGHGEGRALDALVGEVSGADVDALSVEAERLDEAIAGLNTEIEGKSELRRAAELAFNALDDSPDAAIAAFEMAEARSEMAFQAELYIRKRAEARLLRMAVERYRQEKQGPLLAKASALFETLTLGAFSRLMVDYDGDTPKLAGVRADGASVVSVEGMSEGTVDQLFLALRIAAVEEAVAQGVRLPFVADDLFINFDDERAAAGFKVLGELSRSTQVLFFTHHMHLAAVAEAAFRPSDLSVCRLSRDADIQVRVESSSGNAS